MPHTRDCISERFRTNPNQHTNEIKLSFYKNNGGLSDILITAEREFLVSQGVASESAIGDMWSSYLFLIGSPYQSNTDGKHWFWCEYTIPVPPLGSGEGGYLNLPRRPIALVINGLLITIGLSALIPFYHNILKRFLGF